LAAGNKTKLLSLDAYRIISFGRRQISLRNWRKRERERERERKRERETGEE
jgi:hypothetical protein